jgi:hypothetical protein
MPNFEALCLGLCEVPGIAVPEPRADEHGGQAIEFELHGVKVVLSHGPRTGPNRALVVATFGQLPAGREPDACRTLLNINRQVLSLGFAFGRNPANGEIVLKQNYSFDRATAADLYTRIATMADCVNRWRRHHFLVEGAAGADAIAGHAVSR